MAKKSLPFLSSFVNKQVRDYLNRHSAWQGSFSSKNGSDVNLRTFSRKYIGTDDKATPDSLNRTVDVEENMGCFAIIRIGGYTRIIQQIALDGILLSSHVSSALENYFSQIIDIIANSHDGDTITACWRVRHRQDSGNNSLLQDESNAVAAAIMCCIQARDFLEESSIWQLALDDLTSALQQSIAAGSTVEDIGLDFNEMLHLEAAIASGTIFDCAFGLQDIEMHNFVLGTASFRAFECLSRTSFKESEIVIDFNTWKSSADYFAHLGLRATPKDKSHYLLSKDCMLPNLDMFWEELNGMFLYDDVKEQRGSVEAFLHDGILNFLAKQKPDDQNLKQKGIWCDQSLLTIYIQSPRIDDLNGRSVNALCKDMCKYVQTIQKACVNYKMFLQDITVLENCLLKFQCIVDSGAKHVDRSIPQVAINATMYLKRLFETNISRDIQFTYAIGSRKAYEGFLLNKHRSSFRLISEATLTTQLIDKSLGMAPFNLEKKHNHKILADQATFNICSNSNLKGYFSRLDEWSGLKYFAAKLSYYQQMYCMLHVPPLLNSGSRLNGITSLPGIMKKMLAQFGEKQSGDERKQTDTNLRCVVIEGIPGSGKSYALERVSGEIEAKGLTIFHSEGIPVFRLTQKSIYRHTLFPFANILIQMFNAIPEDETSFNDTASVHTANVELPPLQTSSHMKSDIFLSLQKSTHKSFLSIPSQSALIAEDRVPPAKPNAQAESLSGGRAALRLISNILKATRGKVAPESRIVTKEAPTTQLPKTKNWSTLESIQEVLENLKEDLKQVLPLLNPLVEPTIDETEYTSDLGPGARTALLAAFFVRTLQKLSASKGAAILIDNVHLMDSASWIILSHIIKRCPRVAVVVTAAPCSDWRAKCIKNLAEMPKSERVELHGWSKKEVEVFITAHFASYCHKVSTNVLDLLYQETQGHPQHVKLFVRCLEDSDILECTDGELHFNAGYDISRSSLAMDMILKFQVALVTPDLKTVLSIASIVGNPFSPEEIAACLHAVFKISSKGKAIQAGLVKIERTLQIHDRYNWLKKLDKEDLHYDRQSPFLTQYYCTERPVLQTFHSQLTGAECDKHHRALVEFYETNITNTTETWYVPRICDHYDAIGDLDHVGTLKQIKYMTMLGNHMCVSAESFMEARDMFETMQQIVEQNQIASEVGPRIMSEWNFRLAYAYSHGLPEEVDMSQCKTYIQAAFELLDFKAPTKESDFVKLIWKEGIIWLSRNWNVFMKKRNKAPIKKKVSKSRKRLWQRFANNHLLDRLERLEPILGLMSRYLFETEAKLWEQIVYDLLYTNVSEQVKFEKPAARLRVLGGMALKLWFAGQTKLATKVINWIPGLFDMSNKDPQTYSVNTRFLTASGLWYDANVWSSQGMEICQQLGIFPNIGDLNNWQICGSQKVFMMIFNGRLQTTLTLIDELEKEANNSGEATWSQTWLSGAYAN